MTQAIEERLDRLEGLLREILDVLKHPVPVPATLDFVALTKRELPEVWAEMRNPSDGGRLPMVLEPEIVQLENLQDGGGVVCATWRHSLVGLYEHERTLEVRFGWTASGKPMSHTFLRTDSGELIDRGEVGVGWGNTLGQLFEWVAGRRN